MIKEIHLKNFKSHKDTVLAVSNLTVLCGSNGVGKSSAVQALLLLRESYLANSKFDYLDLKSNPINIGTVKDALYEFADDNIIGFRIITDTNDLSYSFETSLSEMSRTLMKKSKEIEHVYQPEILGNENLFNKNCQFISAARIGPQPTYVKDDVIVDVYNQISVIEGRAEHFLHYLVRNGDKSVLPELINENLKDADDLFYQTTAWEREICSGVDIVIEDLGSIGYSLNYKFSTGTTDGKTSAFKSINVGFGLSYVMPILVAILSAPKGALIIIENPEAHIHPNGLSKLAELICIAAQAGIQLIVETHSDHIINGILVQCKKFEDTGKGISKDNISLYHFERNFEQQIAIPVKIEIQAEGGITYAPIGFFDQFTLDRKFLMGF